MYIHDDRSTPTDVKSSGDKWDSLHTSDVARGQIPHRLFIVVESGRGLSGLLAFLETCSPWPVWGVMTHGFGPNEIVSFICYWRRRLHVYVV